MQIFWLGRACLQNLSLEQTDLTYNRVCKTKNTKKHIPQFKSEKKKNAQLVVSHLKLFKSLSQYIKDGFLQWLSYISQWQQSQSKNMNVYKYCTVQFSKIQNQTLCIWNIDDTTLTCEERQQDKNMACSSLRVKISKRYMAVILQ